MKRKFFAIMMAAVTAFSMNAIAAEDASASTEAATTAAAEADTEAAEEAASEETDAAEDTEDTAEAETEEVTADILGYYIANYAQSGSNVSLAIIEETDLIATATQTGTTIYNFREDGSVTIYADDTAAEGTYTAEDGKLTITSDGTTTDYTYEIIDNLPIVRHDDESFILYSFVLNDLDYVTIEDYSTIELEEDDVAVSDDDVDSYINSVLAGQTTYETVTDGTTAEGDIITISYEGTLEGEDEPFEGGSGENISLQLGSGALIDTYEDQLIGQEIGSTIDVTVTYPDDYTQIDGLAGKTATFATTIHSKTISNTPELTDEWVQEFSEKYLSEKIDTVDGFKEYSRSYLEEYKLHSAMLSALASKTSIAGYNTTTAQLLVNLAATNLANYASYYGLDSETYASQLGYSSTDAYEQAEALSYLNIAMIVNKIMVDKGMTYTDADLNAALEDYLKLTGYNDSYDVDSYKEASGTTGMWVYTNCEFKYNMVMEALEDNVVITESVDTDSEAETAEAVAKE